MRNDFVKQMQTEMENNKNIVFLTGDLGFNALESLRESFPDRFINVGIAEANMVGIAAGLALTGKKAVVYSIASFLTMRAYEQIRNDICYHNLDVKIVGTGGGFNYSTHGITHHTIEDIAIMNVLPNMQVLCPTYSWEAREATKSMLESVRPVYLRLGKSPKTDFFQPHFKFKIGKGFIIREGKDILLIVTGNILDYGIEIAEIIKNKTGLEMCVMSMPSVKPLDQKLILGKAGKMKLVATLEEHSIHGGLGSGVAMLLSQSNLPKRHFMPFALPDIFVKDVGDRDFLLDKAGLSPQKVVRIIIEKLNKRQ
jgi:transketolase